MRKAIKHIIILCLMLLFGNGSFLAHAFTAPLSATSITKITPQEKTTKTESDQHLFVKQNITENPFQEFYKKKELTVENEEEDSEITASKKTPAKTPSSISFFKHSVPNFISYQTNNSFGFRKEFSYFPIYKSLYIVFKVFRI